MQAISVRERYDSKTVDTKFFNNKWNRDTPHDGLNELTCKFKKNIAANVSMRRRGNIHLSYKKGNPGFCSIPKKLTNIFEL